MKRILLRKQRALLLTLAGSLLLLPLAAVPASAHTADSVSVSSPNVVAGGTVDVTMLATAAAPGNQGANQEVQLAAPGLIAVSAGAGFADVVTNPVQTACLPVGSTLEPEATCLWRDPAENDTLSFKATLSIPVTTPPGEYTITGTVLDQDPLSVAEAKIRVLGAAVPTIAVDPSSTQPGTSVNATGSFTASTLGTFSVGVYLRGTGGQGTVAEPASVPAGLTNCTFDGPRAYICDWAPTAIGDMVTLTVPTNVADTASAGSSFTVEACATSTPRPAPATCAPTTLNIVAPVVPTPTPTPTPSPTVTPTVTPTATPTVTPTATPTVTPTTPGTDSGTGNSGGEELAGTGAFSGILAAVAAALVAAGFVLLRTRRTTR
ncbi:hypothetical protein [Demequina aurantiaca]|uniref:hypothetical protein n=1 Tax=Demequina aurantiaca TaxID=676200 RepID=UPI000AA6E69E|nr:hypothetical protein [Demequina aurantiaca]